MQYAHQTPRVYPASNSQPPPPPQFPPPPPSSMNFSREFSMFEHGNHDTNEKLEYYPKFIATLLEELKTLRQAMCAPCKQRWAASKATGSGNQSFAISTDSTISIRHLKLRHVLPNLPRMPKIHVFWRTRASGSNSLPRIASSSSSLVEISTKRRNEFDKPTFYAERDALADATIDVTFVHSFCHKNYVRCVSFSHDGRYLALGTGNDDKDGSVVIHELEGHKIYCELREYASQYGSYTRPYARFLCFSSDGRYLAVTDVSARIIIWDVPKKRIRSIFHWSGWLRDVRFSPDGRLVASRTNAGLVVLNMRDNSRKMVSECSHFDFNPGGRIIATGYHNSLMLLDVRTGKQLKRWDRNGRFLRRVKFTLDGRGLLCAYEDMVELWDVSDAEPVLMRKFNVQTNFYRTCISPDHRLVTFDNELWDVKSGKRQYTLQGHSSVMYCVDFSATGTYLAMGGDDGFVSLWKHRRVYAPQRVSIRL